MTDTRPAVRRLTLADLDRATEALSRAFADDPLFRYLCPSDEARHASMAQFFRPLVKLSLLDGQAYGAGDPLQAAALWAGPEDESRFNSLLQSALINLLFSRWALRFPRALRILPRVSAMHSRHAPGPHYYLEVLGVAPEAQGQKLSSTLLRDVLARADADGVGTYLETATPSNVGLYEHFGFQDKESAGFPGTDLTIWAMFRPAPVG